MAKNIDFQIDDFMTNCQLKNLTRKTMMSYEQTLRLFMKYLSDNYKIEDAKEIKENIVREYIKSLQTRGKYTFSSDERTDLINNPEKRNDYGKKISISTINNCIRNIKVFFNFLLEQRKIKINPMKNIKQLKNPRKPSRIIEDSEFLRLIKYMDTTKFHTNRDYCITLLLYDTGMRLGECLAIKCEDVDLKSRSIRLDADNTKSRKERYVFFSLQMGQELKRWLEYKDRYTSSDLLFCTKRATPVAVRVFEKNFRNYCKEVGIKDIHPHSLRGNFGRRALMAGMEIRSLSLLLGHSSVTVTEQAYADLAKEDLRKNYQQFSPLANLKKK